MLDLYSDYLISSMGLATATWMACMLDNQICHDKVTKFLNWEALDSKRLWKEVKPTVRSIEDPSNVLIFDDTITPKPYTDENDIVCRHFDHKVWTSVKGTNILTCLLSSEEHDTSISIWYEIITKPEFSCEVATKKVKRQSKKTKNEILQDLFLQAVQNDVTFTYVLYDSRFAWAETLKCIRSKGKHIITELKVNRLIALSDKDRNASKFVNINKADLKPLTVYKVYLKWYDEQVILVRQVFTNKDWGTGERYLLCTDMSLDFDTITSLYKRRWKVEESYKSIKCNTWLAKSPTKTIKSQSNHYFMSIYTHFKLALLSSKLKLNQFYLKSKLYIKALVASYTELQSLKNQINFQILA